MVLSGFQASFQSFRVMFLYSGQVTYSQQYYCNNLKEQSKKFSVPETFQISFTSSSHVYWYLAIQITMTHPIVVFVYTRKGMINLKPSYYYFRFLLAQSKFFRIIGFVLTLKFLCNLTYRQAQGFEFGQGHSESWWMTMESYFQSWNLVCGLGMATLIKIPNNFNFFSSFFA